MADVVKQREALSAKDAKLSMLENDLAQSRSDSDEARAQLAKVQQEADVKLESLKVCTS